MKTSTKNKDKTWKDFKTIFVSAIALIFIGGKAVPQNEEWAAWGPLIVILGLLIMPVVIGYYAYKLSEPKKRRYLLIGLLGLILPPFLGPLMGFGAVKHIKDNGRFDFSKRKSFNFNKNKDKNKQ